MSGHHLFSVWTLWAIIVDFGIFRIIFVFSSIFRFIYHILKIWIQNHINNNKIKEELELDAFSNRSKKFLLDSESDKDYPICIYRWHINITESGDELLNHHQMRKIQDHKILFRNQFSDE